MSYVDNVVSIMKDGKKVKDFKQRVSLSESDSHFLEFSSEIPNADGSGKSETSIFTVDKNGDNSYFINLWASSILKDEEGKSYIDYLKSLHPELESNASVQFALDAKKSKISMSTNGEELKFDFTGLDGEKGKITTSATSITLEINDKTFSYSTNNENAIDVNINKEAVKAFLDKENKLFKTPSKLKDFPSYLIGMLTEEMEGNQQIQCGDYTITAFHNPKEPKQPYIFVSRDYIDKANGPSTETFIYADGVMKLCANKFLYQY